MFGSKPDADGKTLGSLTVLINKTPGLLIMDRKSLSPVGQGLRQALAGFTERTLN